MIWLIGTVDDAGRRLLFFSRISKLQLSWTLLLLVMKNVYYTSTLSTESPGLIPVAYHKSNQRPHATLIRLCYVWWDSKGIIYWELLPPNTTITANIYCQQLDRLAAKIKELRPSLQKFCSCTTVLAHTLQDRLTRS